MKRVCVFSGSSSGSRLDYLAAADALARELVARDLGVVYGGAGIGLMGRLAESVLARGGSVIGVIPEALAAKELQHRSLTELHVVGSMHERKAMMADLADGFIALPGGLGTLDETFEILAWAQLGLHAKPVGLLNVCGYYDGLIAFLDHAERERFVRPEHRNMLAVAGTPPQLLTRMSSYLPPAVPKWIDRAPR
jgi:uncharacterized protein (TIGR00730 family)